MTEFHCTGQLQTQTPTPGSSWGRRVSSLFLILPPLPVAVVSGLTWVGPRRERKEQYLTLMVQWLSDLGPYRCARYSNADCYSHRSSHGLLRIPYTWRPWSVVPGEKFLLLPVSRSPLPTGYHLGSVHYVEIIFLRVRNPAPFCGSRSGPWEIHTLFHGTVALLMQLVTFDL